MRGFAIAGAALTFFGLMHSEQIGIAQSPFVAAAYLCVGALLLGCTKLAVEDEDLEAAGQSV